MQSNNIKPNLHKKQEFNKIDYLLGQSWETKFMEWIYYGTKQG